MTTIVAPANALLAKWPKQPGEVLDFDISFADYLYLRGDTIASKAQVDVTVGTGITLDSYEMVDGTTDPAVSGVSVSVPGSVVKLWLSGGSDGVAYTATAKAHTVGGRQKEADIQIKVKEVK